MNIEKKKLNPKGQPQISVIIVSKNRQVKLLRCLAALRDNSFSNIEIIVIEQGFRRNSCRKFHEKFPQCIFFESKKSGKSRGLNQGLKIARAPIIAFTDDDCIPDKLWLASIHQSFSKYHDIYGVMGKTLPYKRENHIGLFCPSLFENKIPKSHAIEAPCKHSEFVGLGNNASFRRKLFDEVGNFKEWLGPGSVGSNCEDGELIIRSLIARKKLFYNSQAIVFHDRWITELAINKQWLSYICGEAACYTYFSLRKNAFCQKLVRAVWHEVFYTNGKRILLLFLSFKKSAFPSSFWWLARNLAMVKGTVVAFFYFYFAESISFKREKKYA